MNASDETGDGVEEAKKGKAAESWEEGYQALIEAREALLSALGFAHRFIREEVGPGVFSQAHVRANLADTIGAIKEGFEQTNRAWVRFQTYYRLEEESRSAPSIETGSAEGVDSGAPEPVSVAQEAAQEETCEASQGHESGQADRPDKGLPWRPNK